MRQTVDARGLGCPQPVVLTLRAIQAADEVTTIVDNRAAVENVTRLAHSQGCSVHADTKGDGIYLTIRRAGAPAEADVPAPAADTTQAGPAAGPLVLFVPSDRLGRGATEMGERLMTGFLHALLDVAPKPRTIIFVNSGVRLATEGSGALEDLRTLADRDVEILACGTCLEYLKLSDKLAVGRVSNLHEVATRLMQAGKVVEL